MLLRASRFDTSTSLRDRALPSHCAKVPHGAEKIGLLAHDIRSGFTHDREKLYISKSEILISKYCTVPQFFPQELSEQKCTVDPICRADIASIMVSLLELRQPRLHDDLANATEIPQKKSTQSTGGDDCSYDQCFY